MPLKAKPATVYVPGELLPLIKQRLKDGPYHSLSAYFVALAIYDLMTRREHKVTAKLMAMPESERDEVIASLVEDFANGKRKTSSWFEHEVERVARTLKT